MPVPSRRLLASLGLALVLGSTLSRASEDRVVLESDELRVTIDPASNGRIASIRSKKNGVEHLEPAVIREEVQSPLLPTTIVSNHGGVEDWFWKQYVTPRIAFRLKDQGGSPAGPWATVIGNINGIHVERRMTLLKSFPALQVDVMLSSDAPVDASYWLHIVVAGNHYLDKESGKGMLAGTFSGDPTPRQGRGMLALKQAGPQTVPIAVGDIALAPAGNWFARILPGKKVGWYAYYLHTEVPTKVEHLEQNTAVMVVAFAGSFSDYSRGLYDPKSPQNARFLKILEGYHKLTQESGAPLLAHDYWSGYAWQGPLPVVHSMQDKLRAYHRDFGLAGIYNEVHPAWGSQGMALYFYTWLLRHPEGDLESEKDYYYKSFYGPAAEAMRQYHETLENAAWGGPYFGSGGSEIEPLFSNKLLDTLEPFLKEAQEKVAGDETLEKRLQGDVAAWTYARKVRNFYDALGRRDLDGARKELDSLVAYFYQFPDGSVFDNRKSVRGSMDNIFIKYRKLVEREGRLLTFFEEPKVLRTYIDQWSFQTDPEQEGEKAGWEAASFDDRDWKKLKAREPWQAQGFGSYQGTAWYRKSFTVPKFEPGRRLILYFGAVDGDATVYLNGKKIGEHLLDPKTGKGHDEPFFFDVTDILKPGDTVTAAIKVVKTEYVGGLTAPVLLLQAKSIRPPE